MKTFEWVFNVNLMGSVFVTKYAAVQLAKNQENESGEKGLILLVSSMYATEGQIAQTAYSASKGAISGMVLPMARDLGRYGIRAVAVAPGAFETPMTASFPPKTRKSILT